MRLISDDPRVVDKYVADLQYLTKPDRNAHAQKSSR
jgi:hypothetical protein